MAGASAARDSERHAPCSHNGLQLCRSSRTTSTKWRFASWKQDEAFTFLTSSCFAQTCIWLCWHASIPFHSISACLPFFRCMFLNVFECFWLNSSQNACLQGWNILGCATTSPSIAVPCLLCSCFLGWELLHVANLPRPHGFASGEPWMWCCRMLRWSWNCWPIWATERSEATRWCQQLLVLVPVSSYFFSSCPMGRLSKL